MAGVHRSPLRWGTVHYPPPPRPPRQVGTVFTISYHAGGDSTVVIMLEAVCEGFCVVVFHICHAHHCGAETLIHHYNIPLTHSFTCLCTIVFPPHVHPALCLFPLVTVCTVFVFRLFTIHISELELILKYHGQWKEGIGVFVYIYTHVILITKTCVTGALRTRTRLLLHR